MNRDPSMPRRARSAGARPSNGAQAVVSAVLYEGYMLYPYRPSSARNRRRWTIGGLCPETYCARHADEASAMRIECVVEGSPASVLDIGAGFLHLIDRRVHALDAPLAQWPAAEPPRGREVDVLDTEGQRYCAWQEATERRVPLVHAPIGELLGAPRVVPFACGGRRHVEPLTSGASDIVGTLTRIQQPLVGHASVACTRVAAKAFRVTVEIVNTTPLPQPPASRDAAMAWAFVSCHGIFCVQDGAFVSLLDPPAPLREASAACRNVGAWPVLVGATGARDTMLASPILLYDYPQVTAQGHGRLFDGSELDAMLALRILALADAEQRATSARGGACHESWRRPRIAFWRERGTALRVGDRVRLKPRASGSDADLALHGKLATIEAIERNVAHRIHVAVTLDDDLRRDAGASGTSRYRVLLAPDEVEPVAAAAGV